MKRAPLNVWAADIQEAVNGLDGTNFLAGALAADHLFRARVSGDSDPRLAIQSDGKIVFGSGSGAGDATLSRSAASKLSLGSDDTLVLGSGGIEFSDATVMTTAVAGWTATAALTYSSADAPTYVCTTASDLTAVIPVGAKIKLTHAAAVKYFIVTAIDATTITLYGGTDYTLAATAITLPYYSLMKTPLGFPLSPLKWTVEAISTGDAAKANPVQNTWYGDTGLSPTGASISVPIGAWSVEYEAYILATDDTGAVRVQAALSTAANSESDVDFTTALRVNETNADTAVVAATVYRRKHLLPTVKTAYYLNLRTTDASATEIGAYGSVSKTIIRAVCAYL